MDVGMNIIESFRIAWTALMSNKGRSLLTMLGIIIGVGAVIGMLAIGNGLSDFFQSEFRKLGVGVFYISPQVDSTDPDVNEAPRLTAEDAEAILGPGAAPSVSNIVIEYNDNAVVSAAGGERFFFSIKAVTPSHFSVVDNDLIDGRYYDQNEERTRARVVVLGREVAETLFGSAGDAVGRRVTVAGLNFEVVGVINLENSIAGGGFITPNEIVYVPYETGKTRLFRNEVSTRVDVSQVTVQARSTEALAPAIEEVRELLRDRHRLTPSQISQFTITNPEEQARQAQTSIAGLNAFLGIIAGISLLVGGIGIMNIMLVSVTQRTREIGLRKAVGARRRDILGQFLIEAVVLCLIGCLLGIALGFLLSIAGDFVLSNVFRAEGSRATVSLWSVILATVVSSAIGIIFGFFPAMRAARLHPIQALRAE
jgi:putative ABC transport system permease protein